MTKFKYLISIALLLPLLALADAVIFSGNDVKALKYNLDLFGRSKVLGLNVNPSVVSTPAPLGSVAMDVLTGGAWVKTGPQGTDWNNILLGPTISPSIISGIIPLDKGGTNQNITASAGAVVYSDADSFELSAVGTAGFPLLSSGANAPVFAPLDISGPAIQGVLPIANGGTNNPSFTSGSVIFYDGTRLAEDNVGFTFDSLNDLLTLNAGSTVQSAPANTRLHINGANGSPNRIVNDTHNNNNNQGPFFLGRRSRGTGASPNAVQGNDVLAGFAGSGYGATQYVGNNNSASIIFRGAETWTDTSSPSFAQIYTTPAGSTTAIQRMRVTSGGSVVIGDSANNLATTATNGFLYINTTSGIPTGVPVSQPGTAPLNVDVTNNSLYFYSGGAWRTPSTTSGTVTEVALSLPSNSAFTVTGSPVTSSGTLTITPNVATGDILYASGVNSLAKLPIGTSGTLLTSNGSLPYWATLPTFGSGSVSEVAITGASQLLVTGSPIKTSGTINIAFISQASGTVFAGPVPSGAAAAPTFRQLVNGDLPIVQVSHGGTGLASVASGALLYGSGSSVMNTLAVGNNNQVLTVSGGLPTWQSSPSPTVQRFASGSGTYTTPAGVRYIIVEMVGGGGGGGGVGTGPSGGSGGTGGTTTFGTSLLTSTGGAGGSGAATSSGGNPPGTGTINSPAITMISVDGSFGGSGSRNNLAIGGHGGPGPYGGAGFAQLGSAGVFSAGRNAQNNSGAGGSGAGGNGTIQPGGGGASGAFIRAMLVHPLSVSYSYAVGGGGTAGTAGTAGQAGGAGGSGVIVVTEYY